MNKFKPIKSSNLSAAHYDKDQKSLIVRFRNDTEYHYPNVESELYTRFEETFSGENGLSAGKFFNANIRHLPNNKIGD